MGTAVFLGLSHPAEAETDNHEPKVMGIKLIWFIMVSLLCHRAVWERMDIVRKGRWKIPRTTTV